MCIYDIITYLPVSIHACLALYVEEKFDNHIRNYELCIYTFLF